jgi:hypothetical protein
LFFFSLLGELFKRSSHFSLEGGSDSSRDSLSFSFDVTDFLKFLMPSPKDFPSSGSRRAPKMMTTIKMIRISSVGPTGPNKNIGTSSRVFSF